MKIGIIDSGKGALGIAEGIKSLNCELLIIMDVAFFPYGNKSKDFLCKRALYLCDYLITKGVDIIILGCNTLSIYVLEFLKKIIDIKIYGVFDLIKNEINEKNIVVASKLTCDYINNNYKSNVVDGSLWIDDIQNNRGISNMVNELKKYEKKYQKIVLGCTHFLIFKEEYPFKVVVPTNYLLEVLKKEEL